ncbi:MULTISPECIES: PACE efflux transporter [Vibrio]|uniref:Chlorhexidine efflux transporter domain-containing protein n=1 Tax=Vibrio proteolyticus NBRC 13287 TaxID=1219065 RepID=U3BHC9_VIBPR|nr:MULTISPECIES: PACE efflux transporter [Vibrio]NAW57378.1 PACE efflux transporter [Vibrio sp. V36_P2S2PM302]NAX23871.1 PACE efflux transporter [Vibrio sp. V38_P2S17PM301]NAX32503.1 PACE efflux transporter [Vibrio sp. V37_P2S8PM304]GAD66088.1 hypothetical protein VPR01S_02_03390 [Vibrio proteolyticus NBRC 13287]
MTNKERLFHAAVFELLALIMIIPVSALLTGKGTGQLAMVGVGLSLFTVVWNYVYNLGFDRFAGADRSTRSLAVRLVHTTGFEGGLLFITIPTVAWFLNISLMAAIVLEAGFLVFFFIYTMVFNWGYDKYQPYQWLFRRVGEQ